MPLTVAGTRFPVVAFVLRSAQPTSTPPVELHTLTAAVPRAAALQARKLQQPLAPPTTSRMPENATLPTDLL